MNKNININTGATNVKRENIINFDTIDTEDRTDDFNTWNAMQFLEETDAEEGARPSPKKIDKETAEMIRSSRVGRRIINLLKVA